MLGSNPATVEVDLAHVDDGATAYGDIDGFTTYQIVTVINVDTSVLGTGTVTHDVLTVGASW